MDNCNHTYLYINTGLASFLGIIAALIIQSVVGLVKKILNKKNDKKLFFQELNFNIDSMARSIEAVKNYRHAIIYGIDSQKSYDATIIHSNAIYLRFVKDGLIFSLLSRKEIIDIERIYSEIQIMNTQISPAINKVIKDSVAKGETVVDIEGRDKLETQKQLDQVIKYLENMQNDIQDLIDKLK